MSGLSACLIVRDEEELLPDCLASLHGWVDELCVVDTGSADRTRAIAAAHGARLAEVPWRDDFSAARNASLALATEPWVLVIDADERLDPATGPALRAVVERSHELAHLVQLDDPQPDGRNESSLLLRLFRNRADVRFQRPVHESVMDALRALGVSTLSRVDVRLVHLGYTPRLVAARNKVARNLALLRARFQTAPDDLFNAYKLAVTLGDDALSEQLAVLAHAQARLAALPAATVREHTFADKLFEAHGALCMRVGDVGRARAVLELGLAVCPSRGLWQRYGELLRRLGKLVEARDALVHALVPGDAAVERGESLHQVQARAWVSLHALAGDGLTFDPPAAWARSGDVAVQVARLRLGVRAGELGPVAARLGPLLEQHFGRDDVKLLAGELAWASADLAAAEGMWRLCAPSSDPGHAAHRMLALVEHARGREVRWETVRDACDVAFVELVLRETARERALFASAAVDGERTRLLGLLARLGVKR